MNWHKIIPLPEGFSFHHIDGNRRNNDPDNIQVVPNFMNTKNKDSDTILSEMRRVQETLQVAMENHENEHGDILYDQDESSVRFNLNRFLSLFQALNRNINNGYIPRNLKG